MWDDGLGFWQIGRAGLRSARSRAPGARSRRLRLPTPLKASLVQAYQNNPSLNSQRASVRATDEGVPQALSGYRPKVTVNGSIGQQYFDTTTRSQTFGVGNNYTQLSGNMTPSSYGITATQTLFNGFQTANRTRQAESQV